MPEIKDHGKVWMRGKPATSFAVKVEEKVFVPGQEDGQAVDYWLEGDFLCVDLHDPKRNIRIARRFSLFMTPTHPATLFNGFDNTKHADVLVITFQDDGVEEQIFKGEEYRQGGFHEMGREAFWRRAGFSN